MMGRYNHKGSFVSGTDAIKKGYENLPGLLAKRLNKNLDPSRLFLLSTGEWDSGEVRLNFMVILGRSSGEIGALAPGDGSFLGEVGANTPVHTTFDGDCADGRGCGCCGCGCCRF